MLQTRLREIRRKKKFTLEDVAKRTKPPTTAQTIGRLETGARTVSIKWIERIAKALDVEPSELIGLPENGDIQILASIDSKGKVKSEDAIFSLRLAIHEPIAVTITENVGAYVAGDKLLCNALMPTRAQDALGKDCLVKDHEVMTFGKILSYEDGTAEVATYQSGKSSLVSLKATMIAPVKFLIRDLT